MVDDWFQTELLNSSGEYSQGSSFYIRGDSVDLFETVQKLARITTPARYLHIYCDQLTFTGSIVEGIAELKLPSNNSLGYIRIFARSVLQTQSPRGIRFLTGGAKLKLHVYFESCDENFLVFGEGTTGSRLSKKLIINDEGNDKAPYLGLKEGGHVAVKACLNISSVGRRFVLSSTGVQTSLIANVAGTELEPLNINDLEGKGRMRRNQYLRLLLNRLFEIASSQLLLDHDYEQTCISTFRFIMLCSRNSVAQAGLYIHAETMLARLELPLLYPSTLTSEVACSVFYVPILDVKQYKTSLKEFIDTTRNVENIVTTTKWIEEGTRSSTANAVTMMEQLATTGLGFINNDENESAALAAVKDAEKKRQDLAATREASEKAVLAFNEGMTKYLKDQKNELILDCIKGVCEIAVSVGVAVATCGAGAPLTAGTVAKVLKDINNAVTTWDKVKSVLKKLAEVLGKIIPKLWSSFGAYSKQRAMASAENKKLEKLAATKGKNVNSSITIPEATTVQIDYLGLMADWEEFKIQADNMILEIKEVTGGVTIAGLADYHTTLRNTAIRGQMVLKAQRVVQETCSSYYRGLAQSAANKVHTEEAQAIAKRIKNEPFSGVAFSRQLALELVGLKQGLYVMFHKCLLSLIYLSTATKYPADLELSSNMTCLQYENKLLSFNKVWETANEKRGNLNKVPKSIIVDTHNDNTVFDPDWKETLIKEGRIRFHIPYDHPKAKAWWRLRIKGVEAVFEGAVPPADVVSSPISLGNAGKNSGLEYYIELGPQVVDKDITGRPIQYWLPKCGFAKLKNKGGWDDPLNEYVKPALFCHGQILIDEESATGWDLGSVTGVSLDWETHGIKII